MATDGEDRSWVAGIHDNSPVTEVGVRRRFVMGGNLVTPLREYESQDGGYGDRTDVVGGYVNMWGYLSRIPTIAEYVDNRHARLAARVLNS